VKSHSEDQLVFKDTNDVDYVSLLKDIMEGHRIMLENPEADMPGFQQSRAEP
jgi:hypothetical protein